MTALTCLSGAELLRHVDNRDPLAQTDEERELARRLAAALDEAENAKTEANEELRSELDAYEDENRELRDSATGLRQALRFIDFKQPAAVDAALKAAGLSRAALED